ncbi:MAG TPA: succinylglutamate desuccinylase/aspartoacylase family protein [Verrucomicrobiae bacterium]|jgi:predicted deacylase|nr:succinylglutamate desuccinylase/aspartoacylase family protein [Verrucomicrobiae bacterium]
MKRLAIVSLILSVCSAAVAQSSFTVGTATAAPGQKATGYIEVPAGVDAATSIPVVVVRGAKPGPVLALVSGAHGTEYASIIAIEKLIPRLDPAQISGTVILIPLVNIQSFLQKVPHVNPVDGKSMNRFYPGKADGTQTERASYLITKQVVERCDYLLDYHGGDLDENLRPYSYWPKTGNEKQDSITHDMVLAFGLDHIIVVTDRPKDASASRYLDNTATTRGKPAIAVEAGRAGRVDTDDVDALVNGTVNLMRYLKMLPGTALMVEHPVWIGKIDPVASDHEGFFYPTVERGSYVGQGMKLGYVTDYFGNVIYEARAPADGVVLYICSVPSMKKGDTVAYVGEVTKTP